MKLSRHDSAKDRAGHHNDTPPTPTRRFGALLINLGTPDRPDVEAVRSYLAEFLGDPEVIQLPTGLGWMNRPLGHLIARFRAPKSLEMYKKVWTESGSPLSSITQEQAAALSAMLPPDWQVFYAMRYGNPSIARTLKEIEEAGIEELVVIPMYPQFSGSTTGTAVRELYSCLKKGGHHFSVTVRNSWYNDGGYVHAQASLIHEYARRHGLTPDNSMLVFSAHGLPASYVERGDPYPTHTQTTIELVLERLGWPADRTVVGYQSRLGPAKWLEPNVDTLLEELADGGEKRLLVCPISFTVDCLETLEEIDVRYRELVEARGADLFLCPALNAYEPFVTAVKELVLRGPRPITSWGEKVEPLLAQKKESKAVPRETDALVMIGASKGNAIGTGLGPRVGKSTETGLCRVKKSQCEAVPLLISACDETGVTGGFLFNTCYRYEFYGWLPDDCDELQREHVIARIKSRLFDVDAADDVKINVLVGTDAWHHLIRTAAGLNSGLPGDTDILEQLQTAHRVAERAGTADRRTKRLINDALAAERELRRDTTWGKFDPGYCYAAMVRLVEQAGLSLADSRCAVFGGSTTSRSVITTLANRFEVPSRTITLVYRGHGSGQMKLLRKAIGNGKRVRVQAYGERAAVDVVNGADVVVFGIDHNEPVLDAEQIRGCRDFTEQPLTIIDFNTFGSTSGMETLEGVTVWDAARLDEAVVAYGREMRESEDFTAAVGEAEEWIVANGARWQCKVAVEPTAQQCEECPRRHKGLCVDVHVEASGRSAS